MTRSLTYTKHKVPYINRPFLRKQLTFCEQSLPTYCVHQKTSAARQFIHTQNFIEQKENGKKTLLSHTLSHSHVQLVSLYSRALRWHFLRCIRDAAHQFAQLYKSQQHNASACYIAITLSDKMKNYAIVPSCERDNKAAAIPDNQPKPTGYYSIPVYYDHPSALMLQRTHHHHHHSRIDVAVCSNIHNTYTPDTQSFRQKPPQ